MDANRLRKLSSAIILGSLAMLLGCAPTEVRREVASSSDFKSLCLEHVKSSGGKAETCQQLNDLLFKTNASKDIAPFVPAQLGVEAATIDKKIQYIAFNDPNFMPAVAYCYFVFRGWVNSDVVSPDVFATGASGFSILNEELPAYQKWLKDSPKGAACKKQVEAESQEATFDLQSTLRGYVALIGVNPYASLKNYGADVGLIKKDLSSTLAHERIHAYQASCPKFDKWSREEWRKLPEDRKQEMAQRYNAYNWSDLKVAGREYVAFSFEDQPGKVAELIRGCR